MLQDDEKVGAIPCLEFWVEALDIHACREWILQRLHPDGAYCPKCNKRIIGDDALDSFWEERRTHCKLCGKYFTARTGTLIKNTRLDAREIFLLCVTVELSVPDKKIAEILKIHLDSVRSWKKRLEEL